MTTAKRFDVTSLLAVSMLLSFLAICGAQQLRTSVPRYRH